MKCDLWVNLPFSCVWFQQWHNRSHLTPSCRTAHTTSCVHKVSLNRHRRWQNRPIPTDGSLRRQLPCFVGKAIHRDLRVMMRKDGMAISDRSMVGILVFVSTYHWFVSAKRHHQHPIGRRWQRILMDFPDVDARRAWQSRCCHGQLCLRRTHTTFK